MFQVLPTSRAFKSYRGSKFANFYWLIMRRTSAKTPRDLGKCLKIGWKITFILNARRCLPGQLRYQSRAQLARIQYTYFQYITVSGCQMKNGYQRKRCFICSVHYEAKILGAKLPLYRQALGHFLHLHKVEKRTVRDSS